MAKNEKIRGNNLPKIEKIQGKKLKWMLLKGFRKLQKTAQICGFGLNGYVRRDIRC